MGTLHAVVGCSSTDLAQKLEFAIWQPWRRRRTYGQSTPCALARCTETQGLPGVPKTNMTDAICLENGVLIVIVELEVSEKR
jgi:hypothetical protein